MTKPLVWVSFEYMPPFDGNGDSVELGPFFWVEQEGSEIRADNDDSGEPKSLAWRQEIDDPTNPGHKVTVWQLETGSLLFGRVVISAKAETQEPDPAAVREHEVPDVGSLWTSAGGFDCKVAKVDIGPLDIGKIITTTRVHLDFVAATDQRRRLGALVVGLATFMQHYKAKS